eukprot:gnl/Chilomastix_cuspidata/4993.p1 GENE.gnl/Chilomastix_cuspidata/4993~~gnl/Chilomastix_cuspidata/4993.p1  ORF type:complete len:1201 (-),score=348.58 gnl/Chilomastix_cuspidata/4993:708-4310(-)
MAFNDEHMIFLTTDEQGFIRNFDDLTQFIVEPNEEDDRLICNICFSIAFSPVTPDCCNHIFCNICMSQHLMSSHLCPLCRREIISFAPVSDDLVELSAQIQCPHPHCRFRGLEGAMKEHLTRCAFQCPRCGEVVDPQRAHAHNFRCHPPRIAFRKQVLPVADFVRAHLPDPELRRLAARETCPADLFAIGLERLAAIALLDPPRQALLCEAIGEATTTIAFGPELFAAISTEPHVFSLSVALCEQLRFRHALAVKVHADSRPRMFPVGPSREFVSFLAAVPMRSFSARRVSFKAVPCAERALARHLGALLAQNVSKLSAAEGAADPARRFTLDIFKGLVSANWLTEGTFSEEGLIDILSDVLRPLPRAFRPVLLPEGRIPDLLSATVWPRRRVRAARARGEGGAGVVCISSYDQGMAALAVLNHLRLSCPRCLERIRTLVVERSDTSPLAFMARLAEAVQGLRSLRKFQFVNKISDIAFQNSCVALVQQLPAGLRAFCFSGFRQPLPGLFFAALGERFDRLHTFRIGQFYTDEDEFLRFFARFVTRAKRRFLTTPRRHPPSSPSFVFSGECTAPELPDAPWKAALALEELVEDLSGPTVEEFRQFVELAMGVDVWRLVALLRGARTVLVPPTFLAPAVRSVAAFTALGRVRRPVWVLQSAIKNCINADVIDDQIRAADLLLAQPVRRFRAVDFKVMFYQNPLYLDIEAPFYNHFVEATARLWLLLAKALRQRRQVATAPYLRSVLRVINGSPRLDLRGTKAKSYQILMILAKIFQRTAYSERPPPFSVGHITHIDLPYFYNLFYQTDTAYAPFLFALVQLLEHLPCLERVRFARTANNHRTLVHFSIAPLNLALFVHTFAQRRRITLEAPAPIQDLVASFRSRLFYYRGPPVLALAVLGSFVPETPFWTQLEFHIDGPGALCNQFWDTLRSAPPAFDEIIIRGEPARFASWAATRKFSAKIRPRQLLYLQLILEHFAPRRIDIDGLELHFKCNSGILRVRPAYTRDLFDLSDSVSYEDIIRWKRDIKRFCAHLVASGVCGTLHCPVLDPLLAPRASAALFRHAEPAHPRQEQTIALQKAIRCALQNFPAVTFAAPISLETFVFLLLHLPCSGCTHVSVAGVVPSRASQNYATLCIPAPSEDCLARIHLPPRLAAQLRTFAGVRFGTTAPRDGEVALPSEVSAKETALLKAISIIIGARRA